MKFNQYTTVQQYNNLKYVNGFNFSNPQTLINNIRFTYKSSKNSITDLLIKYIKITLV